MAKVTIKVIIKKILLWLLLIYSGLAAVLFAFQARYIYQPDTSDFNDCAAFSDAIKNTFETSRGYLIERSPDKVIVFYHGNAGRACDRAFLDDSFRQQNYSVYFVEYSGYAEESAQPSFKRILQNVKDTSDFINSRGFTEVVVMGESIGVGPATYHSKLADIDNLVLIAPYTNLASVAAAHYPIFPMKLLLLNNYTPDVWLSDYNSRVTFIVAEHDEVTTYKLGIELFEIASSDEKELRIVSDGGHNTLYDSEQFWVYLHEALE